MDCPNCKTTKLLMTERLSIEIDYCPQCRGVWLDRGELDKIIERSSLPSSGPGAENQREQYPSRYDSDRDYQRGGGHYKKKKKEGFLSELFDFD